MEPAMTMTFTTYETRHGARLSQVINHFNEWRRRARSRHELESLSDATLRDIGMTRCDVHRESNKPFWMA
jgi:uncharacterized protein YjiS (DUF1127 family)